MNAQLTQSNRISHRCLWSIIFFENGIQRNLKMIARDLIKKRDRNAKCRTWGMTFPPCESLKRGEVGRSRDKNLHRKVINLKIEQNPNFAYRNGVLIVCVRGALDSCSFCSVSDDLVALSLVVVTSTNPWKHSWMMLFLEFVLLHNSYHSRTCHSYVKISCRYDNVPDAVRWVTMT